MTAPAAHLTTAQLAERWHTSANAIRLASSRGQLAGIKSFRRGKKRLWPLAGIEAHERQAARPARKTAAQPASHAA